MLFISMEHNNTGGDNRKVAIIVLVAVNIILYDILHQVNGERSSNTVMTKTYCIEITRRLAKRYKYVPELCSMIKALSKAYLETDTGEFDKITQTISSVSDLRYLGFCHWV